MYRHISKDSIELDYKHLEEIAAAFPDLSIDSVKFKDDGLIYDYVTVNDEWMFRFPKYDWAVEDMLQESTCLVLARNYSPVTLPEWELVDKSFARYRKIGGIAMTPHEFSKLDSEAAETVIKAMGMFLKSIHEIPKKELKSSGIADSVTAHSYDDWLKLYDDVQQELYSYLTASAIDAVNTLFRVIIANNKFTDYRPALVNGELTDHHIIFDPKEGVLTGIIDFSSSGKGDPATDIACLLLQYGEQFVSRMAAYYPAVRKMIDRARFIALTYPLQWALGGIRTGDYSWMLVHIGRTGTILPIGSPLA